MEHSTSDKRGYSGATISIGVDFPSHKILDTRFYPKHCLYNLKGRLSFENCPLLLLIFRANEEKKPNQNFKFHKIHLLHPSRIIFIRIAAVFQHPRYEFTLSPSRYTQINGKPLRAAKKAKKLRNLLGLRNDKSPLSPF